MKKLIPSFLEPYKVLLSLMLVAILWLLPTKTLPVEEAEPSVLQEYKVGLSLAVPGVDAACSYACQQQVCTKWIPLGSPGCPTKNNPWDIGCCTSYKTECIPGCGYEPPPPPSYSPPTVTASIACTVPGGSGWCVGDAQAMITATDPQNFALSISGQVNSTPFTCTTNPCEVTLPVGQGTVTYSATAPTSGLSSSTGSVGYKVDTTKPVINQSLTGTNGTGGWWKNATFTASASDSHSGLQSLILTVNGAVRVSPFVLPEGTNTIVATASDIAGNVQSQSWVVNVDSTPPGIAHALSGTLGDAGWYKSATTFTATASDPLSGVQSVIVTDNGAARTLPFTLSDGVHNIIVTSVDRAGNSTSAIVKASVDSTAPSISPFYLGTAGTSDWWVSDVKVDASATDPTSGMSVLEVSKDGGMTWQSLPVTFTDGVHAMMIRARDKAGNVSTVSRTMSVDTILPTLTSAKTGIFGERSWYITPVNIHLSGADVGSGVKTIQHRINGGAWTTGSSLLVSEDGVYALEYRVTDNAGNVFSLPDGLQKDTTLPNTSILSPSHLTVTDKTITVAGSSDDSMSGLDVVEISIDSGKSWQPLTPGSWSYSFDSSDMPNGELKILSRATDRAGNKFQSESSVLLANHAPQVSLPETWVFTEAGGLSVLTDFFDISSVRITVMDSTGAVLKSQHLPVAPYHIAWDGRLEGELLPAGNYPVSVVVCDVNRKCGTATAIITIPEFSYLQPEPPAQAVPTQEVVIIPAPEIVKEEPHPVQRLFTKVLSSAKPRDADVLLLSGGFLLFLLTQTVSDPRPRAMRSLAKTIRSTMLNKE